MKLDKFCYITAASAAAILLASVLCCLLCRPIPPVPVRPVGRRSGLLHHINHPIAVAAALPITEQMI